MKNNIWIKKNNIKEKNNINNIENIENINSIYENYIVEEKYNSVQKILTKEQRIDYNQKILNNIDKWISKDTVFNIYTWNWWLHWLNFNDFDNFAEYSKAKKDIEFWQFFTQHETIKNIIKTIRVKWESKILEMWCWKWDFINYIPKSCSSYWFDIDKEAIKVANYLYWSEKNIFINESYNLINNQRYGYFDYIIWNPPFNIKMLDSKWNEKYSQDVYLQKINEMLLPWGFTSFIIPKYWLSDSMMHKESINFIRDNFNFIGQFSLPNDEFKFVWIKNFETKVIFLQKKDIINEKINIKSDLKLEDFDSLECPIFNKENILKNKNYLQILEKERLINKNIKLNSIKLNSKIELQKDLKNYLKNNRMKLLNKYLELDEEKKEYINDLWFKKDNEEKPINMDWKEWEKKRITLNKVLWEIKKEFNRMIKPYEKKIQLIHEKWKFILKWFDNRTFRISKELNEKYKLNDNFIINWESNIDSIYKEVIDLLWEYKNEYKIYISNFKKLINKKIKIFNSIKKDSILDQKNNENIINNLNLGSFNFDKKIFWDKIVDFKFQKDELLKIINKNYYIVNFEQWLWKTIMWIGFWKMKKWPTLVIWPSIAIKTTWQDILPKTNSKYELIEPKDLYNKKFWKDIWDEDKFYLTTFDTLNKWYKFINKGVFKNIILDESDWIKNNSANRTKSVLSLRNKVKNKLIMSWTLTRNNISEIYSQLVFLLNNSYLMSNNSKYLYNYEKNFETWEDIIIKEVNEWFWLPIPFRWWLNIFKKSFSPNKTSVFWIEKNNQDIYNIDALKDLLSWMSSRLEQKDILWELPYNIKMIPVNMTINEEDLYKEILFNFYKFLEKINFWKEVNDRKKSQLQIVLQIQELLKSTSMPFSYKEYKWWLHSKAIKMLELIEENKDKKIMIWTNWIDSNIFYKDLIKEKFPNIPFYFIESWKVTIGKRKIIADKFNSEKWWAILLSTTWSLSSSINIWNTELVLLESLRYNFSEISQYIFRAIRIDSSTKTEVKFLTTNSLEKNLIWLIIDKERLTSFVNKWEVISKEEISKKLWLDENNYLDGIIKKVREKVEWSDKTFTRLEWWSSKINEK